MATKPHYVTSSKGVRFDVNTLFVDKYGIKPGTIDYSKGVAHAYAYTHEKNKKKKLYAQAYLRYMEGRGSRPDISKYKITAKQAENVRRNMAGYAKFLRK